ncbi:BTA121 domain-containing protein surface lipoprotein [Borrelia puertoricensis]|uniref:BTA121 domain-containing protein surface lipoprotein n=1 Tax=Borrelia puertoricensis TaxID=2756107 RepID=UPI001FF6A103|nr:hypothetical protein [Borrelia puertoricensis]UPA19222.1 hypothetical protein bpuSUM_001813 [Borrelia puertoricensis]
MQQTKILKGLLNDEEKTALAFLQYSITKPNPDNYQFLTLAHGIPSKVILNLNIDKLKSILSNIIPTLKAKKEAEDFLANYNGLLKDKFIQILKIATTQYIYFVKTTCSNPNFDEIYHKLTTINNSDTFENIINTIKDYNNVTEQLSNDEKEALTFLNSITKLNPNNPNDQSIITNINENLNKLILNLSTDQLKSILSNIILTLKAKKEAKDSLDNYNNPLKDILTKILKDTSIQFTDLLISICNTPNFDEMHHNLSKINNADTFENIINTIKHYNNVTEQLSNDEKEALSFLKYSIIKPNPDDSSNHSIITNAQVNLHKLILNTDIDKLKSMLSNIILILKTKKEAENSLANYNGTLKDTFIQRLENASTQFTYLLINICHTSNFDEIHHNLSTINNADIFENIINTIKHYNNVIKQHLNNDEKEALVILGNSIETQIKRINKITTTEQISLSKFIINLSTDQLKSILSNIILILKTKKEAEDSLENYNGPLKNTFIKKLENASIQFIKLLKGTYNASNFDTMYHHLSITNAYLFKDITSNIEGYNNVIKQLNNEEQETLTSLANLITKPNPNDPNDHNVITNTQASLNKLILNLSIDKLKLILSNIIPTLKAKKEAEDSLTNYNDPLKNTLTKKLEDVTTQVINTLRSIYNTPNFDEIYHNLSTTNNTAQLFESVASDIKNYNNIIKQLNDDEKGALTFLENSITKPNPNDPNDHNIITNTQASLNKLILNLSIDKLKLILSNIIPTLKAKIYAENSIINHDDPLKNTLIKVLEDAITQYTNTLKNICNTLDFDEIYRNLLTTNNTAYLFEAIASDIKDYNNVIKQLNDDEKGALIFLQYSIIKPNPDDSDDHNITIDEQEKFDNLILNLNVANIKVILLNMIPTLKAKKEAEDSLTNYNRPLLKNTFIQILKTVTTQYIQYLKNMCYYTGLNKMHCNLSTINKTTYLFEAIAKAIQHYNNNIEQLSDDEKESLIFLQYSITKPNSDDLDDYNSTIGEKEKFNNIILNLNIDRLKPILSNIILTLKAKKEAEDSLENYNGPLKDTFTQRVNTATTQYIYNLKNMCSYTGLNEIHCNLLTINNANVFKNIVNDIKNYNNIIEQLNDDEKEALSFLKYSITKPNPVDPDEYNITINAQENLHKLTLNSDIDKFKSILSNIILTLKAKKEAENTLENYNGPLKDTLTKILENAIALYENLLKIIFNTPDFDEMYNNLSITNNANTFENIINDIKIYNSTTEQLNDDEKGALSFLKYSITKPNPIDPDYDNFIIYAQINLHKLILKSDIDKLKKAISDIVTTLDSKKDVEDYLRVYTGPSKDTLTQMLKDTIALYENHLKSLCKTSSFDKMYNNLSTTNNANIFENIVNDIKNYNNIIEQLNDNEKGALTFLENSITKPNPDDLSDHSIIMHAQSNLHRLIINFDIDKLKQAIAGIVITLNTKKEAEDSLENYNEPLKDTLTKMLKDTTTSYANHLKNLCKASSLDEIYGNLSTATNNANIFENIVNDIKNYNNTIEQLNVDEKESLTFLENFITKPNPDDSSEHNIITHAQVNLHKLILNSDIDKFKSILSNIIPTLKVKKEAEDSLQNYNGPLKDTLTKMLKDATKSYANHLKSICNTPDFNEMYNNLSTTNNTSHLFENIIRIIKNYNNTTEQLNVDEKEALTFLKYSITKPNPYDPNNHNIIINAQKKFDKLILNFDTDKLKLILSNIIPTLKVKKEAEDSLQNYNGPLKNTFTKKLEKSITSYANHLKNTFNTVDIEWLDLYLYITPPKDHTSTFEHIVSNIELFNSVTEQLNVDEKEALSFLENSIIKPNPDDSSDHSIITNAQENLHKLILNTDIDKLKSMLSNIILTLKVKKEAENSLANYNGTLKDKLTQRANSATTQYIQYLKNSCNTSLDKIHSNLSTINNTSLFQDIINNIKLLNSVTEQLNDDEKEALSFLENSIIKPNPDDSSDHSIITNAQENLHKLILNLDIDKLKSMLSNIILTLKVKKEAENSLANYNGTLKDKLTQRANSATTQYIQYLKNSCNTSSLDKIHSNLSTINNTSLFQDIIKIIKHYNNVIEQLNDDEKGALSFLENSIKIPNPYDHRTIINMQEKLHKLTLKTDINKLKSMLSNIILTLNTKKEAENSLANYNGTLKDKLTQRANSATTQYIQYLKDSCNTSLDKIHSNLSTTNSTLFILQDIIRIIKHYNNVIEQLNDDEKGALSFLKNSIKNPNPNDPNDHSIIINSQENLHKLILNLDIDKLKQAIAGIVTTLDAKKEAEESLENYNGLLKDIFTKMLKDATTQYIQYLKNSCNTNSLDKIHSNLSTINNTSLFQDITSNIKLLKSVT